MFFLIRSEARLERCFPPLHCQPMISNPRQNDLLLEVRARGVVSVEALAEKFGVTLQTLRRDVQKLAEAGLVTRFHGGVRVPSSTTENIAYRQRQALNLDAKARIAKAIAARIAPGSSLFLNLGTTTEAVARELLKHKAAIHLRPSRN